MTELSATKQNTHTRIFLHYNHIMSPLDGQLLLPSHFML